MSLARFESLFQASSDHKDNARWRDTQLQIDLSTTDQTSEVWVEVNAHLTAQSGQSTTEYSVDLVPASVLALNAWVDGVPSSMIQRGAYHGLLLGQFSPDATEKKLRFRYPVRLTRGPLGGLSGVIPLPPVSVAQVKVIGGEQSRFIPELPVQSGIIPEVSLHGAIAVILPSVEEGQFLQEAKFNVHLDESGEGATVDVELNTLLRGEIHQAWIPIAPAGEALIEAKIDSKTAVVSVRDGWHVVWAEGSGLHRIEANLLVAIDRSSGQPSLTLSPQKAPKSSLSLELFGEREVTSAPLIPLNSKFNDLSDPVTIAGELLTRLTSVTANLPPLDRITLKWTEKRATPESEAPEFLSETYQLFSLQEGLLKGQAQVELDVIKGELKRFEIEIPAGVVLYQLSGDGVEGWVTRPSESDAPPNSPKRVRVTFGEPRRGKTTLSLKWQRVLSNNESLTMPLIRPLDAFQESGVIALFDGDRVGFTPAKPSQTAGGDERLIPVGQEAIPQRILQLKTGEKVSQAFRHVQAPTALNTSTTTERARELRFDAQLDTLYSVRDGAVRAQSQLLINLKSGRLDALVIALPSACSEPQVSGPSINRVEPIPAKEGDDPAFKRYQIRFTRRLEGAVTLNLDAEQLISTESATLSFPRLIVEGAELTQGHLGVSAEAGLEVSPSEPDELRVITLTELPRSITLRASSEVLYGYRFSRDWSLSAGLKRHKLIETLTAEATALHLESYLLESGQQVDQATYTIENQGRRAVKVKLPAQAKIQTVSVNGSAVRARAEGEFVSIPIPKDQTSTLAIRYEVPRETSSGNSYELIAPTSDMRTSSISWDLNFSPDRQLWNWEGKLAEGSTYRYADHERLFPRLTQYANFTYDLLPALKDPLTIKVSLRGVISAKVMHRISFLSFFAILLIGFRRGLALSGREANRLRYLEWGSLILLGVHVMLQLYQSSYLTLEGYLIDGVCTLIGITGATWVIFKIKDKLGQWTSQREERRLQPRSQDKDSSAVMSAGESPEDGQAPEPAEEMKS